jgi:hypothetical protein
VAFYWLCALQPHEHETLKLLVLWGVGIRPLGWAGGAGIVGRLLGQHHTCCRVTVYQAWANHALDSVVHQAFLKCCCPQKSIPPFINPTPHRWYRVERCSDRFCTLFCSPVRHFCSVDGTVNAPKSPFRIYRLANSRPLYYLKTTLPNTCFGTLHHVNCSQHSNHFVSHHLAATLLPHCNSAHSSTA